MKFFTAISTFVSVIVAQNTSCPSGFQSGTDVLVTTIPYTYSRVLTLIGSFGNLTWAGTPPSNITLNGPDNTPGTTRTYQSAGATLIETLITWQAPASGPFVLVYSLNFITVPSFTSPTNVTLNSPRNPLIVTSTCNGLASQFNFNTLFCADNVTAAAEDFNIIHRQQAQGVARLLGGQNFTSCAALQSGSPTASATGPVGTFTGAAATVQLGIKATVGMLAGAMLFALT